jgi:GntR family transcriptional regulator
VATAGHRQRRAEVIEALLSFLSTGKWRPGDRVPSEVELAQTLGVSRATLRDAYRSLEDQGYFTRIRGAGTFVTHRPRLTNDLEVNFGVTELIRSKGMVPGTEQLRVTERAAEEGERRRLALPDTAFVVLVERVRTADGDPVVFSQDVLPSALVQDQAGALREIGDGSMYEFLRTRLNITIHHGLATIRPVRVEGPIASALRLMSRSLAVCLIQTDYDPGGRPVLLSSEFYVADAFEFTVHRKGPDGTG